MSFRDFLDRLEKEGRLIKVKKPVSLDLEASGLLKSLEDSPVLLEDVGKGFSVAGNLFTGKGMIADYFKISPEELIPMMIGAISNPTEPRVVEDAPCQEEECESLDDLPILFHCKGDGGRFISSGVAFTKHPEHGQNVCFHRCMQISKDKFSVRVVSGRHTDQYLQEQGVMDFVICVGNSPNVMLAAATSVGIEQDEIGIANALENLEMVKAKTCDILIPADSEFVIEGTLSKNELADEGPFVDLTETQDIVRQQPVFTVKRITHRKGAVWHALLPGGLEHKTMMGMPREPTIFRKVTEAGVKCMDVSVNPGGCSWLHGLVKIDKQKEDDGRRALEAAFEGHSSMKHAFVVDKDIDILDPLQVEWAMATRFQGDRDLFIRGREPGSSLDPSAEPGTKMTYKMGYDMTKPLKPGKGKNFEKVMFPEVDKEDFLE